MGEQEKRELDVLAEGVAAFMEMVDHEDHTKDTLRLMRLDQRRELADVCRRLGAWIEEVEKEFSS